MRGGMPEETAEEWANEVDTVSEQIRGIIDGTISDFDEFDHKMDIKDRMKRIKTEELEAKKDRFFKMGREGKGEGRQYKWWCRRCFVEYLVDLPENQCSRCHKSDKMVSQEERREELLGKLETFKKTKATHSIRKDKWLRWKKSQAMLKRSKYINYKAWSYWEPDTDTEDEGDPCCPRDNPEFLAMEADMMKRKQSSFAKSATSRKCKERGNECMKEGDFVAALENYEEGLEYRRDDKTLWTNKALAELKVFRWHDAINSCNKVIEYSEIFEDGFMKSKDPNFKAFTRRAVALRALHRWEDALSDLEDALKLFPKDKEAKDLYEKTKVALAETKKAHDIDDKDEVKVKDEARSATPTSPVGSIDMANKEQLEPGSSVRIDGLTHHTELNGLTGTIEEFDSEKEAWTVNLDNGVTKRVRSGNLELIGLEARSHDLHSCDTTEAPESAPESFEPAASEPAKKNNGPVRIAIDESSDDEEEEEEFAGPSTGSAGTLAGLTSREFKDLMDRLKKKPQERMKYCSRGVSSLGDAGVKLDRDGKRRDGKKLELKVEEVVAPSGLDGVIKDVERCSVLWRKYQGKGVALNPDVKQVGGLDEEPEDRPNAIFLKTATPRCLKVLHLLAVNSEHHAELSAAAMRFVWPLLSSEEWRHSVLELLMEWSQRSVSARSMAEFASRYPMPNLSLLVQAITQETKENVLPPGFDERMKASADKMESGEMDMEAALGDVLEGLNKPSIAELAVSTLGNICLAGQNLALYKEQLVPFCDDLVAALKGRLRALDWRLCGKAAGAICNIVRLGDVFSAKVEEICIEPILKALQEEGTSEGSSAFLQSLAAEGNPLGMKYSKATGRLLGALVNLVVVRPTSAKTFLQLNALDVLTPLIDPDAQKEATAQADATPVEISSRAVLVVSRLVGTSPGELSEGLEAELLKRLHRLLDHHGAFASVKAAVKAENRGGEEMDSLELAVRLLTTILVKTPGALARMIASSEGGSSRIEELPDDYDVSKGAPSTTTSSWGISDLVKRLTKLMKALQPPDYLGPEDEATALSRMRGNIALLLTKVIEAQSESDAVPAVKKLDFSPLVSILIDLLRKENNKVQHNIGVCVTRLAQNERYRQLVRDLNGIETLHQVQLPRVQAQKEKEMKTHRIRGPVRDDEEMD